ncbi:MAG: hypothetical protein AB1298_05235 [Bacteroidota bacterium]
MKPKLFLFVFVSVFTLTTYSQTKSEVQKDSVSNSDLWAIQFQLSQDFQLTTFEGSTLSLKRILSSGDALRFGISIDGNYSNTDNEDKNLLAPPSVSNTKNDQTTIGFSVSALYLWYSKIKNHVSVYYGVGPTLSFGYNKTKNTTSNFGATYQTSSENINSNTSYGFGASAKLGIEWFLLKNISVIGEYGTDMRLTFSKTKIERNANASKLAETTSDTNRFLFTSSGVRVGFSIYF